MPSFKFPCDLLKPIVPGLLILVSDGADWRGLGWNTEVVLVQFDCSAAEEAKRWDCIFPHTYLSVCSKDRWPDTHLSPDTRGKERNSITHTTEHPYTPSTHPPLTPPQHHFLISSRPPLLPHSPSFSVSLILFFFHLFKSLHFRCIHTFPISLCMSLSPLLPPHLPLSISILLLFSLLLSSPLSFFLSLPPILTSPPPAPPSSPIFHLSSLPPSHYCNPSFFHQPPCKQASWLP